jgi:hypothetical protein
VGQSVVINTRTFGTLAQVALLLRVHLIATTAICLLLLDVLFDGSFREAARYALLDAGHQLIAIVLAFCALAVTLRLTGDAMIDQFGDELITQDGAGALLTRYAPALCVIALGASAATPFLILAWDEPSLRLEDYRQISAIVGTALLCLGLLLSVLRIPRLKGLRTSSGSLLSYAMSMPMAVLPLTLVGIFSGGFAGLLPISGSAGPKEVLLLLHPETTIGLIAVAITSLAFTLALRAALFTILEHGRNPLDLMRSRSGSSLLASVSVMLVAAAVAVQATSDNAAMAWAILLPALLASGLVSMALKRTSGQTSHLIQRFSTNWNAGVQTMSECNRSWTAAMLLAMALTLAILFVTAQFATTEWSSRLYGMLGPIGIALVWGSCSLVLFFPIAYLSHFVKLPLLSILFASAVAFSAFDLNDNHRIRTVSHAEPMPTDFAAELNIGQWLEERQDLSQYDRYPIYIIATEGGGIRAAYFTASVLGAIQDICPAFAQHVIAISGVSGGSVGATVFAASTANLPASQLKEPCRNAAPGSEPNFQFTGLARATLSSDFLSPALGATLFPDAVQRLLPYPVQSFDRAVALERELERSWRQAWSDTIDSSSTECDPKEYVGDQCALSEPLDFLYRENNRVSNRENNRENNGASTVPNLILNTTEVSTGFLTPVSSLSKLVNIIEADANKTRSQDIVALRRTRSSSIKGQTDPDDLVRTMSDYLGKSTRMPASTAAILSARFPYLSPAGRVDLEDRALRFVDGGYFENSGTWIASAFARNLMAKIREMSESGPDGAAIARKLDIYVLVISSTPPCRRNADGAESCDLDAPPSSKAASELLSPLRALLNARNARSDYSKLDLALLTKDQTIGPRIQMLELKFMNKSGETVPLSWLLSSQARVAMDNAVDTMITKLQQLTSPQDARPFVLPAPSNVATRLRDADISRGAQAKSDIVGGDLEKLICSLMNTQPSQSQVKLPNHCSSLATKNPTSPGGTTTESE